MNGEEVAKFKGISAVTPEKISVSTNSQQGVVGQNVTVKAQVTVKEGQSKAGIAVTFNIDNSKDTANGSFNKDQVVEVYTNADGVAEYSYTQYATSEDYVTAYVTGSATVRSTAGKVYWGTTQRLTVAEVTTGNVLANGAKKVYKVKSAENADDYVNVTFEENVNVSPDKLVRGAKVLDVAVGNDKYPYQVTTGGKEVVRVKLNSSGEATFTVTGSNASVTPIVFDDSQTVAAEQGTLESTELQAKAATVKFELSHTLGLDVKAEGTLNAASTTTKGEGGRNYTVTVTDKDGKLAPNGTKAYVTFAKGSLSTDKKVYIDGKLAVEGGIYEVVVKEGKGQAKFKLTGEKDAYATPTLFLNNGSSSTLSLDDNDLQKVGDITYFVNAVVNNATLTLTNEAGDEVTTLSANKKAIFTYQSVDQNGFDYYAENGDYEVTFEVTAQFSDVYAGSKLVKKGTTESVKVKATQGAASLIVTSVDGTASNVTVNASASQVSLPNQTASLAFTASDDVPSYVNNATVEWVNVDNGQFKLAGYATVLNYKDASFYVPGKTYAVTKSEFEALFTSSDKINFTKGVDGKHIIEITTDNVGTNKGPVVITNKPPVAKTGLNKSTLNTAANIELLASDLATDVDAGAVLSFVGNVSTSNATVASAAITGGKLVIDPINTANGTTTITVDVKDNNNATVTVTFDVFVVSGSVTGLSKTKVYVAPVAAKPAQVTTGAFTGTALAATDEIAITVDGGTAVDVSLAGLQTAAQVANAIIAENITGLDVKVSDDKVVLTSTNATPASGSIQIAVGSTVGATKPSQFTAATTTGVAAVSEAKTEFKFTLASVLAAGEKLVINGEEYTLAGATAAAQATDLVNKITANTSSAFTATSASDVVTLTAKASSDVATPTVVVSK